MTAAFEHAPKHPRPASRADQPKGSNMSIFMNKIKFSRRSRRGGSAGRLRSRPWGERLEDRTAPAVYTWTGLDAVSGIFHWSAPNNWSVGGNPATTAPPAGSDLVFPASAGSFNAVNDIGSSSNPTTFDSITIQGAYTLSGVAIGLTNGITDTATSAASTISFDTTLGTGAFIVNSGDSLTMSGALSGSTGLTLGGAGTLVLSGSTPNTYTGTTTDNSGTLELDKSSGVVAVPANLTIAGLAGTAIVSDQNNGQIDTSATVTTGPTGTLALDGFNETITSLTMTGGTINTGSTLATANASLGSLTVSSGIVTTNASSSTATIIGELNLGGSVASFNVAGGQGALPDLNITGANTKIVFSPATNTIVKNGSGYLSIDNTVTIPTGAPISILQGRLDDDASSSSSTVSVAKGATFGGGGIVGATSAYGGFVSPGSLLTGEPTTLSVAGLTLAAATDGTNSTYLVNIASPTSFDSVQSSGPIALSAANLQIVLGSGFSGAVGDTYDIITNNSGQAITGTFAGLAEGATITVPDGSSTVSFRVSYVGGTSGHDVVLTEVNTTTTSLSTSPGTPTVYGEPVTLSSTVTAASGTPTGTVSFYAGTTLLGTAPLNSGTATLSNYTALPLGNDSLTAVYSGDADNAQSTSSVVPFTVNQASTTTIVVTSGSPTSFGQSATFSATVAAVSPSQGIPTGTVTFFDGSTAIGGATLNNGVAQFTTSRLSVGTHSITATYAATTNFAGSGSSASPVSQVVNQATPALALSINSLNPAPVYGQTLTFTATAAPQFTGATTPTGSVTFEDGSTVIATVDLTNGSASYQTTLAVGSHTINVIYNGDANYASTTLPGTPFNVAPANVAITIASQANPAPIGQTLTLVASLSVVSPGAGTPTGSVTFVNGSTTLGTEPVSPTTGQAVIVVNPNQLTTGLNAITAHYSGDSNFNPIVSSTFDQYYGPVATTTVVATAVSSSVYGQVVGIYAAAYPTTSQFGSPSGYLTFFSGSTNLGSVATNNGDAVLFTSSLPAGDHLLTAIYTGNAIFATSTATPISLPVSRNQPALRLVIPSDPSVSGQPVTLYAGVVPQSPGGGYATGTVAFFANGSYLGSSSVSNNLATLTVPFTGAGQTLAITASYSGDANFLGSSSPTVGQTIVQAGSVVNVSATLVNFGGRLFDQFLITVGAQSPGSGGPTGRVEFFSNNRLIANLNLVNSFAVYYATRPSALGRFFQAAYQGDQNFRGGRSNIVQGV